MESRGIPVAGKGPIHLRPAGPPAARLPAAQERTAGSSFFCLLLRLLLTLASCPLCLNQELTLGPLSA